MQVGGGEKSFRLASMLHVLTYCVGTLRDPSCFIRLPATCREMVLDDLVMSTCPEVIN